jgi:short-subunit dehydrogenase
MLDVNVYHMVCLSKIFYQQLLDRSVKTSKHCGLVNISSLLHGVEVPYNCTYAATKALMTHFTNGLKLEYDHLKLKGNLDIQVVNPAGVATAIVDNPMYRLVGTPADVFVKGALGDLGLKSMTYGILWHEL